MIDPPSYLNADAVAQLLGVTPKTVSRWSLTDPTMPTMRIGRTVRFPEAALHRWLSTKTSKARSVKPLFSDPRSREE